MSILQNETKQILLPLLQREEKSLTPVEQEALAVWLTMFAIVYETTAGDYATTTIEQRATFKTAQKPPEHWIFWCAPFDGLSLPVFHTGLASKDLGPVINTHAPNKVLASLTLWGAGAVSFAVFSTNVGNPRQALSKIFSDVIEQAGFVRLWPTTGVNVRTIDRRLLPLGQRDLSNIRNILNEGSRKAAEIIMSRR